MTQSATTLSLKPPPATIGKTCGRRRRVCKFDGCIKQPRGAGGYCLRHGGVQKKRSCKVDECDKYPYKDGKCLFHGGKWQTRHGGVYKRPTCQVDECSKFPQGAGGRCIAHGGQRLTCQVDGCSKCPQGAGGKCGKHGGVPKPCTVDGCDNLAVGSGKKRKGITGKVGRCTNHGGGPRCMFRGCDQGAIAGTEFCVKDGGGIRCAKCKQFCVKIEGFWCYGCRSGTKRIKQLELMVKEFLDAHPDTIGLYSYHDQTLPCSDNRRRGDFVFLLPDRIVILEVDEHRHHTYLKECEVARVTELMAQGQALPLFLIRFNPLRCLLDPLHELLQECFRKEIKGMLDVSFLGYKEEDTWDYAVEIDLLARQRL